MIDPETMIDFDAIAHGHPYRCLTSRLAWESVRNTGWINKCSKIVYQIFCLCGPITLAQLENTYAEIVGTEPKGRSESNAVRRFCELKAAGLVEQAGVVTCPILNKPCNSYQPTNNVAPVEKPKLPEFVVLWDCNGGTLIYDRASGENFKEMAENKFHADDNQVRLDMCRVYKTVEK